MPSCLQARVCLCGDRGKAVFKFASWVHKSTARAFRADRDATVDAAFVFLRLSYYNTAHVDDEAVPTLDGFVHLPYFRWSPLAGVVREMDWPDKFVDEFNRAHLVATDVYRNTYQHADLVVDEGWRRIELRFYMLHESDRPLPIRQHPRVRGGVGKGDRDMHALAEGEAEGEGETPRFTWRSPRCLG